MSDDTAIKVENLSKTFKLPLEASHSLKSAIIHFYSRNKKIEIQKALQGINFEVKKGEFFGIIGRNGSGKSTLLKIIAGIYYPTEGSIHVNGKLTPFIELGVGFNQELSGRENVFLNGALLGFNHKEMNEMYKDIVEFAELERFMDQKLKNYSSGMQVRLAFSIAIRARSDILLIDEVLAVGDMSFQKKCLKYFETLKQNKKTVILVTHDMASVERFCSRVLVLDKSKQIGIMSAINAKNTYDEINATNPKANADTTKERLQKWGNKKIEITGIELYSDNKKVSSKKPDVVHGKDLEIVIKLRHNKKVDSVVGIAIYDEQGVNVAGPNTENLEIGQAKTVSYRVDKLGLNEGDYTLAIGAFDKFTNEELNYLPKALSFRVVNTGTIKHGRVDLFGQWKIQ